MARLRMLPRRLDAIWPDGSGRGTRIALSASLFAGVVLVGVGVVGDLQEWWDDLPFFTNFLTGLTGALFGVPFGFVVLDRVAHRQADAAERRALDRLIVGATSALIGPAHRLLRAHGDEPAVLVGIITNLRGVRSAVEELGRVPRNDAWRQRQEYVHAATAVLDQLSTLGGSLVEMLPSPLAAGKVWAELCQRWRYVDDYIRPRTFEQEVVWLRDDLVGQLDAHLRPDRSPVLQLLELRDEGVEQYASALQAAIDGAWERDYVRLRAEADAAGVRLTARLAECAAEASDFLALFESLESVAEETSRLTRRPLATTRDEPRREER